MKAIDFVNEGRVQEIEPLGDIIQQCINTEDKVTAKQLIKSFEIDLCK